MRLSWRQVRPGLWSAGNFDAERIDGRWILALNLGAGERHRWPPKNSLHECQATAGAVAHETPLLAVGELQP
jgi:hypothetical protein